MQVGPRWVQEAMWVVVVGGRAFCGSFENIVPLPSLHCGQLITLDAQLCPPLAFLLVDPCQPQESNSAHSCDTGCCWRKGKQEGAEHVPVKEGVLSLVGTCCEAACSPFG